MDDTLLKELADSARAAARAGGEELMRWRGKFETRTKGHRDFVTDADLASQNAIADLLASLRPDDQFFGEESGDEAVEIDPSRICWVVDPLDGTTNYLHDYPYYSVSIAATHGQELLAGAILDPLRGEMFWAAAGQGAWLGEERIQTHPAEQLSEALVAMSLPASVSSDSPDLRDFARVAPQCQAVRRMGSAALNLAYVGCGRLNAYWAREIHAWDIAAGALIVREAGGVVSGASGGPLDIWTPPCIASGGNELHQELLRCLV